MAWRYHGRASVSVRAPVAFAICDRCGFQYNRTDLKWQFEVGGFKLYNKRLLVCNRCLDIPQQQFSSLALPPDPLPILNPRPDTYREMQDSPVVLMDQSQEILTDTNGAPITAVPDGVTNTPPYPFSGFTMLRSPYGGVVMQIAVRDDGLAVTAPPQIDVQVKDTYGQPVFSTTPPTSPSNTGYNNLNQTSRSPQSQYDYPVILEVDD